MQKTLISKGDIIKLLNLADGFSCEFSQFDIQNIELYEFRKNLGFQFYKDLTDNLIDAIAPVEFTPNTTYPIDTVVKFCEKCYVTIKNSVTTEPTNVTDWKICTNKFSGTCKDAYNEFYNCYLGYYLSLCVFRSKLAFIFTNLQPEGALKYNGSIWQKSNETSEKQLANALSQQIRVVLDNMSFWVENWKKENPTLKCFDNYKKNENEKTNCGCGNPEKSVIKSNGWGVRFG